MELDQIDLCIPVSTGHSGRLTHLHMHPMPEINIQISGVNNLRTPTDSYRLLPDSICIILEWLPHEACPDTYKGEDFCHFVIQHSPSDISFHFSHMLGGETVIIARSLSDLSGLRVNSEFFRLKSEFSDWKITGFAHILCCNRLIIQLSDQKFFIYEKLQIQNTVLKQLTPKSCLYPMIFHFEILSPTDS
mgnify:CR=1 FL=1